MSIRTDRVARMIQREVADLLQRDFSEATQSLVTVTDVRMTKDLGIAYINVSVLGDTRAERDAAFARVDAIRDEVRQALAGEIRNAVRRIPELRFFLDDSAQQRAHMDSLFDKIRAEREERGVPHTIDPDNDSAAPSRGDY